jgi:hypothetical protein
MSGGTISGDLDVSEPHMSMSSSSYFSSDETAQIREESEVTDISKASIRERGPIRRKVQTA